MSALDPSSGFPHDLQQPLETLWDYLALSERPQSADVIFVFGSQDLSVPSRAAELYREGHASRVLVTGRYGRMTRDVFSKPEALVFKDRLVAEGVPSSAVLTEPTSANTLENVRLGMETMHRCGHTPGSALLVAKGFVMRRCVATFAQQFPRVAVCACPPGGGLEDARDRSERAFALRLVAEVDRLDRYAAAGHICHQEIPSDVRHAVRHVAERMES